MFCLRGDITAMRDLKQKNETEYIAQNPIIEIKNLRKVYKIGNEKVVALDNITLSVSKGEICCLLGTSGSGKSTLLNMIAGLEKPTKGTILIRGQRIDQMNEKMLAKFRQGNMGFVF